jgi:hypothetical protein
MRSRTKDGRVRLEIRLPLRLAEGIRRLSVKRLQSYNAVIVELLGRAMKQDGKSNGSD